MRRKHFIKRDRQTLELALDFSKRTCSKCKVNPVYLDIRELDLCSECIWEFVNEEV